MMRLGTAQAEPRPWGFHVNPTATALTIIGIHHAGGSALGLLPLFRDLPADVGAAVVDLAGRGTRSREPWSDSFNSTVSDLLTVTDRARSRPHMYFGHSLGGTLAYAMARSCPTPLARCVVLSACSLTSPEPRVAPRTGQELTRLLRMFGGTPQEVFETPELLELALDVLGRDLELLDQFRPPPPTTAPALTRYQMWYGRADHTTTVVRPDVLEQLIGSRVETRVFAGGHFYLQDSDQPRQELHRLACRLVEQEAGRVSRQ